MNSHLSVPVSRSEPLPVGTGERVGTATGAGVERRVNSSGNSPSLEEMVPRRGGSYSRIGSHRGDVGAREFGSL